MAADAPRPCRPDETLRIAAIINSAADAYRGVIPADCWHDPYMPEAALLADMAAGVTFWGCEADSQLVAVMGVQPVDDVTLIRHAYVLPAYQNRGAGRALLTHLCRQAPGRILVGAWEAAAWAVAFYRRNGFALVGRSEATCLLQRYWTVSARQIAVSVVLARPLQQDTCPA